LAAVVVKSGPEAGRRVELDDEIAIGRQDGDLVLEDPEVSRRHAVLRRTGGSVVVEDLESTNGTFVNGERIRSPREVLPGDQVRVGRTTFVIEPDPRADDTFVSRPEEPVDQTIVSLPLPPGQIPSAKERPPREPRMDVEDATRPLPSREPPGTLEDATRPLPPREHEAGGRPTRSRKGWLVWPSVVILAVVLAIVAYARFVDRPTEKDFASSVHEVCAVVQRSDAGIDLSRTPTSGELQRALNIRLQALGAMRVLEPPELDAELSRFLAAFAKTNASITALNRSIGSGRNEVARARGTVRENVRDERGLASTAGIGECGGLGFS
jgi:hypothetical protein